MIYGICAVDSRNGIGNVGQLPWPRIVKDLERFKLLTSNCIVIMGRKTFKSLKKPLPDRINVVITSGKAHEEGNVIHCDVDILADYLQFDVRFRRNIYIIGGSQIYELFLPYITVFYLTRIVGEYESDVKFDDDVFRARFKYLQHVSPVQLQKHETGLIPYYFETWTATPVPYI